MSIGQLGTSGQPFRDFLGGGQQDIGRGLQSILSNYASPNGNFVRLEDRSRGMFQLTSSEYQQSFDRDAQNSFAQTWYSEYRAVLMLRAEALKKKLNRAYHKTLENSIYAPMRPNEAWAPQANRDHNDIHAKSPLEFYSGATVIEPPTEAEEIDTYQYIHPEWFSGSTKLSGGEGDAYNDVRRYINSLNPLSDIDGDGDVEVGFGPGGNSPYTTNTGAANAMYYDLWNAGENMPFGSTVYDLNSGAVNSNPWYQQIALNMNVPPTTTTTNFKINSANPANTYYIEIPGGMSSKTGSVFSLLPTVVQDASAASKQADGTTPLGSGLFDSTQKTALVGAGIPAGQFVAVDPLDATKGFYLDAGTKFYDPTTVSQELFIPAGPFPYNPAGVVGGMTLNPNLVAPPGVNMDQQDYQSESLLPTYQQGFVDSWREARQLHKREAQIEAAYKAYLDGRDEIISEKGPVPYEQIMDQVFTAIDQVSNATMPGTGSPPGVPPGFNPPPPTLPPGVPSPPMPPTPPPVTMPPLPSPHPDAPPMGGISLFGGLQPYGTHYQGGGVDGGGNPVPAGFQPGTTVNVGSYSSHVYQVGSDYSNGPQSGSVYDIIFSRLSGFADPTGMDGANSGTNPFTGMPPPNTIPGIPPGVDGDGNPVPGFPPITADPPPPPSTPQPTLGDSHLYAPIPIGAAELNDGQPNVNYKQGTAGLTDTTGLPFGGDLDAISNLFVGRQWDYSPGFVTGAGGGTQAGTEKIAPVRYDAETISSHLAVLPFVWYDPYAKTGAPVSTLTMNPPIEGYALQIVASTLALGRLDDVVNNTLGGPFFHVGGGSDSRGIVDLDGDKTKYSFNGTTFGLGIGGIYWGHTSAIGTIGKVERLMSNSGSATGGVGPVLAAMNTSLGVLSTIGGADRDEISYFPNVGIGGFHLDMNIPIPIPIPFVGLFWLNIPMTTYGAASYDILTDYMYRFLDAMKHEVVDSVSVYSYATSGGYAMDSYGMRGEYHFTEKTAWQSLEKMPSLLGIIDFGAMLNSALGLIGITSYDMNNYDLRTEGVFGGDKRHSMNAAEARELDTGAFFSTAAFLSQFQIEDLSYSYWTGTHQNEEMANMDTLRMLSLTGKELMKFLNKAIFSAAGKLSTTLTPFWATALIAVMDMMLQSYQESLNENLMWDLLLRDQNEVGFVTSNKLTNSSLTAEGYDFIEDERKLFEYDYEQNRPAGALGLIGSFMTGGVGSFELPNQVMNGMANTRRFKPYLTGPDGRAGRQGYSNANFAAGQGNSHPGQYMSGTPNSGPYLAADGNAAHPLARTAEGDNSRWDNNWDLRVGFWQDTGMGDINEVYVRKNVVSYTNDIENGLQGLTPTVVTEIDRYVGSHNRIIGRSYEGAVPLNLESFRTGYFANKYFGTFINTTEAAVTNAGTVENTTTVRYNLAAGSEVDGRTDVVMRLHGGQKYYDRRNDYYIAFNGANLTAKQALAPVLGGRMKLAEVDQNNPLQALGRSTTGEDNPLTQVLYDHMRVRADGSNAQLVREYRDVFNSGLLDDIFITASANAPTGGGVTSSIRIKFRTGSNVTASNVNLGAYEDRRENELSGSLAATRADGTAMVGTLLTEPGYIGSRDYFTNSSKALAEVYLSSFFAFKRDAKVPAR